MTPSTVPPHQANAVPRNEITGRHAVAKPAAVRIPTSAPRAVVGAGYGGARRVAAGRRAARTGIGRRPAGVCAAAPAAVRSPPSWPSEPGWSCSTASSRPACRRTRVTPPGRSPAPPAQCSAPIWPGRCRRSGPWPNGAMFSVSGPPDHPTARRAWETQQTVRRTVHRGLDRRQRVRALLAVGSAPRRPSGRRAGASAARRVEQPQRPARFRVVVRRKDRAAPTAIVPGYRDAVEDRRRGLCDRVSG